MWIHSRIASLPLPSSKHSTLIASSTSTVEASSIARARSFVKSTRRAASTSSGGAASSAAASASRDSSNLVGTSSRLSSRFSCKSHSPRATSSWRPASAVALRPSRCSSSRAASSDGRDSLSVSSSRARHAYASSAPNEVCTSALSSLSAKGCAARERPSMASCMRSRNACSASAAAAAALACARSASASTFGRATNSVPSLLLRK